jgi:hypothetical protein
MLWRVLAADLKRSDSNFASYFLEMDLRVDFLIATRFAPILTIILSVPFL